MKYILKYFSNFPPLITVLRLFPKMLVEKSQNPEAPCESLMYWTGTQLPKALSAVS